MMSFIASATVVSACSFAFAMRNESQHQRLEQLALLDPLTGVKNRRAMDEHLLEAVAMHGRNRAPYGLAILDLDHFKTINDTYGHSVGDDILMDLVSLIEGSMRRTDRLFRFGGEEFVLLLPGVDEENIALVIKKIQDILHKSLKSPAGRVTASFGVALLRDDEDTTSWVARADQALYQAKANGRDQIVLADA